MSSAIDRALNRHYSGFINVSAVAGRTMHVHYLYMESENDPATDPTILWSNGGPGASSMFGILVELGPLLTNENSLTTDDYKATEWIITFNKLPKDGFPLLAALKKN